LSHAGNNVKAPTQQINFSDYQPDTTGRSDCADILTEAISVAAKAKACLVIPPGKFLLLKTITLPSFVVIKGAGSSLTHFIFDLKGSNKDCFFSNWKDGSQRQSDHKSDIKRATILYSWHQNRRIKSWRLGKIAR
jgi:hypothetical protein